MRREKSQIQKILQGKRITALRQIHLDDGRGFSMNTHCTKERKKRNRQGGGLGKLPRADPFENKIELVLSV